MEYLITRVYRDGRPLPPHLRHATTVRGALTVRQEHDPVRHRYTLIARVVSVREGQAPAPLYDAALVASTGGVLALTGIERVADGSLAVERCYAQSWLIEPAALEDLIRAEREWSKASARVAELEAMIKR